MGEQEDGNNVPDAKGEHYTHVTCPVCHKRWALEGDMIGETVECDMCNSRFRIVS